MTYEEEVTVAKQAAREAGAIIEDCKDAKNTQHTKDVWSAVVTEADIKAQQHIVSTLTDRFPSDGFLGEEDNLNPDNENRVWIIDPLDGTKNFTRHYPAYCTAIALKDDGEYVVGVVYNPVTDTMYHAAQNQGAYRGNEEITVAETEDLENALLATYPASFDTFNQLIKNTYNTRIAGAAALDAAYIATGSLDIYLDLYIHEWDVAASAVLIQEAGGRYQINQGDGERGHVTVAAANPALFDTVMDAVGEHL